ncbi:hypothetical protein [Candidatus Tokpelaia sp.]|uniref:hypothetical protein n=1 Tax=Candidatus Tokpelaia sp. TaxID=2233777 RepID=UPI001238EEA8|nr:hypothetical protein [Candidatus Tokpelaia sp.]KAA6405671.1 hypothetical protein DPQ22_03150 [Candidatus Tokpelaia sp.]
MAKTPNYNLELPDEKRNISEEFPILRKNEEKIDTELKKNADAIAGKADKQHSHAIADVTGLQAVLDKKADADQKLKFADLADVVGFDLAALGYVAVKTDKGIEMRSPQAAIGDHKHNISDITGLAAQLETIKTEADRRNQDNKWSGSNTYFASTTFNGPVVANGAITFTGGTLELRSQSGDLAFLKVIVSDPARPGGGLKFFDTGNNPLCEISYAPDSGVRVNVNGIGDIFRIFKNGDIVLIGGAKFGVNGDIYAPAIWRDRWGGTGDGYAWAGINAYINRECVRELRTGGYWEYGGYSSGASTGRREFMPGVLTMTAAVQYLDRVGVRDLLYRVGNDWRQPWIG